MHTTNPPKNKPVVRIWGELEGGPKVWVELSYRARRRFQVVVLSIFWAFGEDQEVARKRPLLGDGDEPGRAPVLTRQGLSPARADRGTRQPMVRIMAAFGKRLRYILCPPLDG